MRELNCEIVSVILINELKSVVFHLVFMDPLLVLDLALHRWEQRIKSHPHHVFNHRRDHPLQGAALSLQAGVDVDLNQPELQVLVHHEVKSENLKVVKSFMRV